MHSSHYAFHNRNKAEEKPLNRIKRLSNEVDSQKKQIPRLEKHLHNTKARYDLVPDSENQWEKNQAVFNLKVAKMNLLRAVEELQYYQTSLHVLWTGDLLKTCEELYKIGQLSAEYYTLHGCQQAYDIAEDALYSAYNTLGQLYPHQSAYQQYVQAWVNLVTRKDPKAQAFRPHLMGSDLNTRAFKLEDMFLELSSITERLLKHPNISDSRIASAAKVASVARDWMQSFLDLHGVNDFLDAVRQNIAVNVTESESESKRLTAR